MEENKSFLDKKKYPNATIGKTLFLTINRDKAQTKLLFIQWCERNTNEDATLKIYRDLYKLTGFEIFHRPLSEHSTQLTND